LIYGEHRALLSDRTRLEADLDLAVRLMDDRAGPLTLPGALTATEALIADEVGDPRGHLADYRDYLVERIAKVTDFRRRNAETAAAL
jgi:exodeoxyribonuclease-1